MSKVWELLSSKIVFSSPFMSVKDNSYRLPDGSVREHYFHLDRPNYVIIIATNNQQQLLVEKQYRRGISDFVYELPAGWIENHQTPITTAKKELSEETGFITKDLTLVGEIYPQPAFSSMKAYVIKVKLSEKTFTKLEKDEFITSEFIPLEKIKKMIQFGKIKDMGFLAALSLSGTLDNL